MNWYKSTPQLKIAIMFLALPLLLFAVACDTVPESGVGEMEVRLHDDPGDYDEVNVFVERVEVNRTTNEEQGWEVLSEPQQSYNLLELMNGTYEVLGIGELETGTYRQIRLIVDQEGTYVVENGEEVNLTVPSGAQTGLKLNINADIQEGIRYVLLLDFDADRSVVKTGQSGQGYILQPVIRAIAEADAGAIAGTITPADARAAAYAILNAGTAEADTVSTTFADENSGEFMLVALPEETYTVSIEPREDGYEATELPGIDVTVGDITDVGEVELEGEGSEENDE